MSGKDLTSLKSIAVDIGSESQVNHLLFPGRNTEWKVIDTAFEDDMSFGEPYLILYKTGSILCCGVMHIMYNLRNPRCTVCTKCRAMRSDRPLKSYHIDHLLLNQGSSVTFVRRTLTDHFSVENDQCSLHDRHDRGDRRRSVMCTEEAYRGSHRTYRADICTILCMAMCRQTQSISVHAHVHTGTKRTCRWPQMKGMHVISCTLSHRHR
jgi:hypothetical protein